MRKMKPGDYEPRTVGVGEETILDIRDGETYWVVQLEQGVQMDVEGQTDAEILARLVRVEALLKKKNK